MLFWFLLFIREKTDNFVEKAVFFLLFFSNLHTFFLNFLELLHGGGNWIDFKSHDICILLVLEEKTDESHRILENVHSFCDHLIVVSKTIIELDLENQWDCFHVVKSQHARTQKPVRVQLENPNEVRILQFTWAIRCVKGRHCWFHSCRCAWLWLLDQGVHGCNCLV